MRESMCHLSKHAKNMSVYLKIKLNENIILLKQFLF